MAILTPSDSNYPPSFLSLARPPDPLWVQRELPPLGTPLVAIVGTRQASEWGKKAAFDFARKLSQEGIWTVSGLARGIDSAAHEGSRGLTVAILGSGFDNIYPPENKLLAEKIPLLSEFSPSTPPHPWNFPKRNRLVAAMAEVILVIEAPEKSGALITVKEGLALGKKCFAVPGPYDRENFKGSNLLIKSGSAEMCLSEADIFTFLKRRPQAGKERVQEKPLTDPKEVKIAACLAKEDLSFDQLHLLTALSVSDLNVHLMNLVLKKVSLTDKFTSYFARGKPLNSTFIGIPIL